MRLLPGRGDAISHTVVILGWLASFGQALAQQVDDAGPNDQSRLRVSLTYQYSETNDLATDTVTIRTGPSYAQALDFSFDYALNERWSLMGGLPVIAKRFDSPSHDPAAIVPPQPESRFIDDGHYHTYFQDVRFGARYALDTEPVRVAPFVLLSVPSNDYPFFGGAAVGQNLRKFEVGTSLSYSPPILKWDFNLSAGYVFVEETLGINVDHTRLDAQAAYLLSPRLGVKFFLSRKHGGGVPGEQFFPDGTERWYQHDRLVRHNYMVVGAGAEWVLNGRDRLAIEALRMIHAQDVFKLRYAFSVTVSRSF